MAIIEYEGVAGQRKVLTSRLVMCDRKWLLAQPASSMLTLAIFVRHPILLSRLTRHYLARLHRPQGTHTGADRTWDAMFDAKWKRGRLRREADEIERLREKYQGGIE